MTTISLNYWILFALLNAFVASEADAFIFQRNFCDGRHPQDAVGDPFRRVRSPGLSMAISPVGLFCPFRAQSPVEMEASFAGVEKSVPYSTAAFSSVQRDLAIGVTPHPDRLRDAADGIEQAVNQWDGIATRLQSSPDFQAKEYATYMDVRLKVFGVSTKSISSMLRWQGQCIRAMADGLPSPMPPHDLDLEDMIQQANQDSGSSSDRIPSISEMLAAERISAHPFDPASFESETVRQEYRDLVSEHSSLIEFGTNYGGFDPLGKISYLERIEKIEERWDAFVFRSKLMNSLTVNAEYLKQCEQLLATLKITEDEYQELLKESHRQMKLNAERERDGR